MIFRPALHPDRESVISLHIEISQQAYSQILPHDYLRNVMPTEKLRLWERRFENLDDPNTQIIVAEHEANVAGFICFQFDREPEFGSYLHNLYVGRDLRGTRASSRFSRRISASSSVLPDTAFANLRFEAWSECVLTPSRAETSLAE